MSTTTVVSLSIALLMVGMLIWLYSTKRLTGRAATIAFIVIMSIKGITTTVLFGGGAYLAWQNMNKQQTDTRHVVSTETLEEVMKRGNNELQAEIAKLNTLR
jgi:predicted negative regulator of RcsB-dependent stress response